MAISPGLLKDPVVSNRPYEWGKSLSQNARLPYYSPASVINRWPNGRAIFMSSNELPLPVRDFFQGRVGPEIL